MIPHKRPMLILLIGLLMSIAISCLMFRYEFNLLTENFQTQTNKSATNIHSQLQQLNIADDKLSFLFQVSDDVTDEDFLLHSHTILAHYSYIKKIVYAPQLKNTHKKNEEKKMQYAGYAHFAFQEFLPPNSAASPFSKVIFPVKLIQPFTPYTSTWFGRDLMTYQPAQSLLHKTIVNNKKLQIAMIPSPKETLFYLFSAVTYLKNGNDDVKTDDIFGVLGYKVDLKNWLLSSIEDTNITVNISINNTPIISQTSSSSFPLSDIISKKSISFNEQTIDIQFQLKEPLYLIDYRIPLLVFFLALLLTFLIYSIEKSHIEHNLLLSKQKRVIENKVTQKTKQLEEKSKQLKSAYTHQLAVSQELEAFSYSISHDLRAPLRSINGFAKALIEDYEQSLDNEAKDMLARVHKNAKRMDLLIEDLLSLSKVSRQAFKFDKFSLSELVTDVYNELLERFPDNHFNITITKNIFTKGDYRLTRIALNNLLNNAMKYSSHSESANIEFGIVMKQSQNIYFIKDNGAGFDMAYASKLFSPFQRLHGAEFEGTGIGLAIVQRIINRHGGKIWAESEKGKGATFFFTLN